MKKKSRKINLEPLWKVYFWYFIFDILFPYGIWFYRTKKWEKIELKKYRKFYKIKKISKLYKKGYSISKISRKLKISKRQVEKYLKEDKKYSNMQINKMPNFDPYHLGYVIFTLLLLSLISIYFYFL
jgi:hypothetical protein